jgi:hypothetical protein
MDNEQSILDTPIGEALKLDVTFKMSDDAESKQLGDTRTHTVTFVFDSTWTPRQLAERCVNASSARVTFQNTHRGKTDKMPNVWNVNKVGTRGLAHETDETRVRNILGDAQVDKLLSMGKTIEWIKAQMASMFSDDTNE